MPTTGTSKMIWKMRQLMKRKPETAMVGSDLSVEVVVGEGSQRRRSEECPVCC